MFLQWYVGKPQECRHIQIKRDRVIFRKGKEEGTGREGEKGTKGDREREGRREGERERERERNLF